MLNSSLLKAHMLMAGVSTKAFADAQGWSMSTLYRKINGKILFNSKEMQIAVDLLGLNMETATQIFFA